MAARTTSPRRTRGWKHLPVIYLSQLVGRAIAVDEKALGLKKHIVDVRAVLA